MGIWSLEDAISQMRNWHVGPVREWLETRLGGPGGVTPEELSHLEAANWWNNQDKDPGVSHIPDVLRRAAARDVRTVAPLVLYIRFVGMLAWELAWEIHPILRMIETTVAALPAVIASLPPEHREDVRGAGALLGFLTDEMLIYPSATAGGLDEWATASRRVHHRAQDTLTVVHRMADDTLRTYAEVTISEEVRYYGAMADAAAACAGIGRDAIDVLRSNLDSAMAALAKAEDDEDPIDRSEMRAHRLSLASVRGALDQEWLGVGRARVTIVCPFGITGVSDQEVVERSAREGDSWQLAGLPVVAVRDTLPVSDIWNTADPLGRSFRGTSMRLPEIQVRRDDGTVEWMLRPEVWFSALGNHVLLLGYELEDALPPGLFDALKLASADYCNLDLAGRRVIPIGAPDAEGWNSLVDFILEFTESLSAVFVTRTRDPLVSYSPGRATAVVLLDEVTAWQPETGHRRPITDARQVGSLYGAQLLSEPLQAYLSSICQWAQYPQRPDALAVRSMGNTWLVRTDNSMTVASFGVPSYILDEVRDCFVFAASMSGLFQGWYSELARHNGRLSEHLTEITHALDSDDLIDVSADRLRGFETELETAQVRLQEFMARSRSTMLFVQSPTLVMSPVIRGLLDTLLEASGYARQAAQFTESAAALMGERLESVLSKFRLRVQAKEEAERERRDRRSRLLLEALMAGVAVAGMSGVASLIQAGYSLKAFESAMMVLVIVLVSAMIAVWVWRSNRLP